MNNGEFDASKASDSYSMVSLDELHSPYQPQFRLFIVYFETSMHGLHTQDLVITLFIIKHRGGEVFKNILRCQRTISLNNKQLDIFFLYLKMT